MPQNETHERERTERVAAGDDMPAATARASVEDDDVDIGSKTGKSLEPARASGSASEA